MIFFKKLHKTYPDTLKNVRPKNRHSKIDRLRLLNRMWLFDLIILYIDSNRFANELVIFRQLFLQYLFFTTS